MKYLTKNLIKKIPKLNAQESNADPKLYIKTDDTVQSITDSDRVKVYVYLTRLRVRKNAPNMMEAPMYLRAKFGYDKPTSWALAKDWIKWFERINEEQYWHPNIIDGIESMSGDEIYSTDILISDLYVQMLEQ